MGWSTKKIALLISGTAVGGAACFLTAGAAAPAIGSLIGSTMGLSGAAATSAGLAALGGGSIAAGGGGIAAGSALITASLTGAGGLLGSLGMGTIANFMKDSDKEFEQAIAVQKDYAKAQRIILQQEEKIRQLEEQLSSLRQNTVVDRQKIANLEKAITLLTQTVAQRRKQLQQTV